MTRGLKVVWLAPILVGLLWLCPPSCRAQVVNGVAAGASHARLSTQPSHYRNLPQVLNGGVSSQTPHIVSPGDAIVPVSEAYSSFDAPAFFEETGCDSDVVYEAGCDPVRTCPNLGGWRLYGWLDLGVTANDRTPASNYNGVLGLNDRNEFQANQVYFILDHPVDRGGMGWSLGGRFDLLFGSDYVIAEQVGWEQTQAGEAKWNNHRHYGLAMPQAFIEAAHGGFSVKAGRFYSLVGYESVMAPDNFFYSHSNGFIHGSPFTHTGLLSTFAFSDWFSMSAGVANGWDRLDGVTDPIGFIGGFRAAPPRADYTFSGAFVVDKELAPVSGLRGTRSIFSMLLTVDCSDALQLAFATDLGNHKDGGDQPGLDAEWYGLTSYAYYSLSESWTLGGRWEWFRDDDGSRVRGVRADNPIGLGLVGSFYEASLGVNWTPDSNIRVRPEVRWDWYSGTGFPYNDGLQDEQLTFAIDAVIQF